MINFYVSSKKIPVGTQINGSTYYESVTKKRNNEWVESILEKKRPVESPRRLDCVYSFKEVEDLAYYGDWLYGQVYYHKVETSVDVIACPMVIIGLIQSNEQIEEVVQNKLAEEYWNSQLEWNILEYLSSSFVVLEEIEPPALLNKVEGMGRYNRDISLAKRVFPGLIAD